MGENVMLSMIYGEVKKLNRGIEFLEELIEEIIVRDLPKAKLSELRPECGKSEEGKPERAEPRSQMDVRSHRSPRKPPNETRGRKVCCYKSY
ncbi:hypothetical protein J7L27_01385 [Candidatus Bathyarchaeota archaeon]|nr:hypothetical protein [Candidatus Bathyarchaeota archaeon]